MNVSLLNPGVDKILPFGHIYDINWGGREITFEEDNLCDRSYPSCHIQAGKPITLSMHFRADLTHLNLIHQIRFYGTDKDTNGMFCFDMLFTYYAEE